MYSRSNNKELEKRKVMAYTKEEKEELFKTIFTSIENGYSLRKALISVKLSSKTFYEWIDDDEDKLKQYARACEERTLMKFESIEDDYMEKPERDPMTGKIDPGWVQMQRLKIDAKKWELSKLNPKKYGDKVDVTSGGDKIQSAPSAIRIDIVKPNED